MNRFARIFALATLTLAVLGCNARTDKADSGGIILSLSIDGWPIRISATCGVSAASCPDPGFGAAYVPIEQLIVKSVVVNPGQPTSELMKVEIDKYEVTFRRDDTGTRLPPRLVETIIAAVDPGGTFTCEDCPVMIVDQFNNQPLRDMIEFGFDTETNSQVIRLHVSIQIFGRTLTGDRVESAPASFTMEIVP
jgi:hypothetical protein